MRNSRKTPLDVILNHLFSLFNIALVGLLIIFIINKSYLYTVPLVVALISSIFRLVLNFKHYVIYKPFNWTCHVLVDGKETEKRFIKLKKGDQVCVYPREKINFTGQITQGLAFVDESKINGCTKAIKKVVGDHIKQGSVVINGNAVVEVLSLDKQICRPNKVQHTFIIRALKLFNDVLGGVVILLLLLTLILNKSVLHNAALGCMATLPFFMNILITIYLYIESKVYHSFKAHDRTGIAYLSRIDTFCFDKTGTITNLHFDVFKALPLQASAFASVSSDTARGMAQVVSDVIKTTNENGGYYKALREYFIYDASKTVEYSSPVYENGLYSLVKFSGGKIYAIGDPDNFDLINKESISSTINEYKTLGYYVLVLAEAKNLSNTGLIEGKSTGIGLIVLQEKLNENILKMIQNIYDNGGNVKVISGDTLLNTAEVCRKAGIANTENAVAINKMSFEQLDLIIDETTVFANASMSQKAYIVEHIKKQGHRVAFIGDGDNDTQAMKSANLAIAVEEATDSAIMCSHLSAGKEFLYSKEDIVRSRRIYNNVVTVMLFNLSQCIFASVMGTIFFIINLANRSIVNPFTYNHLMIWALFGAFIPSVVILLNKKSPDYLEVSFKRNLIGNSLLYLIPVGTIYILQLIQYYGWGFTGITSDYSATHELLITSQVANNLCYLSLILASMFIVYKFYQPSNTFRIVALICMFTVPLVYFVLLGFGVDSLEKVTQIKTAIITPLQYFVALAATIITASLNILIQHIIKTVRGESTDVKSKS